MHGEIFTELSVVIVIATVVALIMRMLRQPLMIGYILTGVLIGPLFLRLISEPDTIEVFSKIGIALLLFIIGLGLNTRVIKEVGRVSSVAAMIQIVFTTSIGFVVGKMLGLTDTEAVFLGFGLAMSSTIIILKLLGDKKELSRLYGKISVGMLLVEDLAATIALLVIASKGSGEEFSATTIAVLGAKGLVIGFVLYIISTRILPRAHNLIAGNQEFLFLFAIAWGFGAAALFETIGFSMEVGALFAGISLAGLPYAQEMAARLRPLRDFFIIVFFISLGSGLAFNVMSEAMGIIIAGILIAIIVKPLIILTTIGLFGYTKQVSFKTAVAMSQISEFSLIFIVLGQQKGLISDQLVGGLTVVAIVSIATSTYMILYSEKIFTFAEKYLTLFERRKTKYEQKKRANYDMILFGYHRGGYEFLQVFQQMKKRFVVIDYDPEVIDILERKKINFLYGDATDVELLEEAGINESRLVVSTISDNESTVFLLRYLQQHNPHAVVICQADNADQASALYELGASYVMIPHYIGSEKISAFLRRSGLSKSAFRKFREKHLEYLENHYEAIEKEAEHNRRFGHTILESLGLRTDKPSE